MRRVDNSSTSGSAGWKPNRRSRCMVSSRPPWWNSTDPSRSALRPATRHGSKCNSPKPSCSAGKPTGSRWLSRPCRRARPSRGPGPRCPLQLPTQLDDPQEPTGSDAEWFQRIVDENHEIELADALAAEAQLTAVRAGRNRLGGPDAVAALQRQSGRQSQGCRPDCHAAAGRPRTGRRSGAGSKRSAADGWRTARRATRRGVGRAGGHQ